MRTEQQQEASRRNGSKSRGPITEEGKAASSQNALRHGALAVVHRPAGEAEGLVEMKTDALKVALKPSNQAELGIVESVGRDLVRLQRAERALEAAARIQSAQAPPMEVKTAADVARLKKLRHNWQLLADQASAVENMADSAVVRRYKDCGKLLKSLVKVESCEAAAAGMTEAYLEFVGLERHLRTPGAEILKERAAASLRTICLHVVKAIDSGITSLEARSESMRQVEEALADLPDERLVRRFDRYSRTTQGAVLRHLQILKELRSLQTETPTG